MRAEAYAMPRSLRRPRVGKSDRIRSGFEADQIALLQLAQYHCDTLGRKVRFRGDFSQPWWLPFAHERSKQRLPHQVRVRMERLRPTLKQAGASGHPSGQRLPRRLCRHQGPVWAEHSGPDLGSKLVWTVCIACHDAIRAAPIAIAARAATGAVSSPPIGISDIGASYPAQHESRCTSLVNPSAASFRPSTVVRYGNIVSPNCSTVIPALIASAAV